MYCEPLAIFVDLVFEVALAISLVGHLQPLLPKDYIGERDARPSLLLQLRGISNIRVPTSHSMIMLD